MFQKLKSYHNRFINKGLQYVTTEFDRRSLRLLNLVCLYGSITIIPAVLTKNVIQGNYIIVYFLLVTLLINSTVIFLNAVGRSQIACLLFSFAVSTMGYVAVYLEHEQVEVPFIVLAIGFFSIFLIKNRVWRTLSFIYSFTTFSVLHYIQLTEREFGWLGFVLTLVVLLIFSFSLQFVNRMRNKDEETIVAQNQELKRQNHVIKTKSEQLLELEKDKHKQALLLKQKDMEMVLTNNQVQTQLNENIINKLKSVQESGDPKKQINQVILELHKQNEINTRMALIEQNLDVVNSNFFDSLSKAHPNITRVDKEFCSYLLIGLSSKEIATIRNTTVNTVNVTKTRLRKKLNIDSNTSIVTYLKSF